MFLATDDVQLIRLSEDHLESVRNWRNSDAVRLCMEYKDIITREMQIEWFRSIDNLTNFYFVINFKGINGGLINISQIDYKNNSAHSGLFLAEGHFRNTPIPILASLSLLKFGFDMLGLNEIFAKVGVNNKTAYEYNTAFGFSFMKHLNEGFDLLKIDKNSFENPVIKFDKLNGVSAIKRMQLVFNKNRGQDDSIRELIFQRRRIQSRFDIVTG